LLVLLALADWANEEGVCWPSLPTIAKKARLGTRQVNNILRRLLADKVISIEKEGGGRGIVNHYRLHLGNDSLKLQTLNQNSLKCNSLKSPTETMRSSSRNPEMCVAAIRKNRQEPSVESSKSVRASLEDVQRYCRERENRVDPQRFFDYYTSNGWKVGRNPMKDWKAAVRTWERNDNDKRNGIGNAKQTGAFHSSAVRNYRDGADAVYDNSPGTKLQ
jgi:hypothetical protein